MNKVNDEYQLHQNEQEAANHSEIHEYVFELAVRYVESAHQYAQINEYFEKPKSVLNFSPGIARTLHIQHDDHEQKKKASHRKAYAIDSEIADKRFAVDQRILIDQ